MRGRFTRYFAWKNYDDLTKRDQEMVARSDSINKDFQYANWISRRTGIPVVVNLRGTLGVEDYFQYQPGVYNLPNNPVSKIYRRRFDSQKRFEFLTQALGGPSPVRLGLGIDRKRVSRGLCQLRHPGSGLP